ncbi:MAG TPA: DEAD/DEAH box helicase [Flavipsychrobacter sp.]|nr:DEAD/DEAH box helicase [Flavipsychrobacter sp.]
MYFTDFDFDDDLLDGIEAMGYDVATPVQEQVIPCILEGKDVIAAAQTGTGKTAAFLLPLIQKLLSEHHSEREINALIVVPTRELAIQITQTLEGLAYYTPVSFIAVYGGNDGALFANERKALTTGADIVVCTPGRLIAHLKMGYLKFDGLRYLVLDEADRMLDMGFYEDLMKIINVLPKKRQNMFFSATMPPQMRKLANTILVNPVAINIAISKPPEQIRQGAFLVFEPQKQRLVQHILKLEEFGSVVVFCSSKQSVKQLAGELRQLNFSAQQIHSDLQQQEREQVLLDFKNKKIKILIATDIISRGIDIEDIDLVINYDVPHDGEDYIHRIGRTARAASKGTAYTFVTEKEQRRFAQIEKLLDKHIEMLKVPEEFGPTPTASFTAAKPKRKKPFKGPRKPPR